MSTDFTREDLSTLNRAIAQGVLSVKYQDKIVTYRSLDEMIRVRNLMAKELGLVNTEKSRILASTSKGL